MREQNNLKVTRFIFYFIVELVIVLFIPKVTIGAYFPDCEIGDAIYRDGVLWGLDWHAGVFYEYDGLKYYVIHSNDYPYGVDINLFDDGNASSNNDFIGKGNNYKGARTMSGISKSVREQIIYQAEWQVGCSYTTGLDGHWIITPASSHGAGDGYFRCDGLVEHCYEMAGFDICNDAGLLAGGPDWQAGKMNTNSGSSPAVGITYPNSGESQSGTFTVSAIAADVSSGVLYVEFQYSTNHSSWYSLPGPGHNGKDWYGANGWALGFDTKSSPPNGAGITYDASVWVRARAMDKAGNLSGWDKCDQSFEVNNAPPVANFTGSPRSGCKPLTVNFTDQSTNNPTSWLWDFGDGGSSTQKNPSHTYNSKGTYTVSLKATNSCGYNTKTRTSYITVIDKPVANFTGSPRSGCKPLTVNFTDQSSNNPTSWYWTFGDGGTSTQKNPSHTYNSKGTYTVSLKATNSCGYNTKTRTSYITLIDKPVANFTGTPTNGCKPLTVNFTDQSTNSPTSWYWTFGDGGTSTQKNSSHTYNSAGTFTVKLTATNNCGSNTKTRTNYITVKDKPVANFGGTPTNGCKPLTVNFTDQSSNNPTSWSWDFGDGGSSTQKNPSHTYNSAGTFTVKLTATNSCGSNTKTRPSYITVIDKPVANFTGTPTNGCKPLTVNFTDQSSNNPTSRYWTFGDGGTSTQKNPSHTYNSKGTYTVTLKATNSCGYDTKTETDYITVIDKPMADFSGTPTSGCKPLTVNFTDGSTNNPTSWSWDFGDGNTSTLKDPSYTYENPGKYSVILIVTNSCGPDTMTKSDYIHVLAPDITVTPDSYDYDSVYTDSPKNATFTVSNTGACSLHVSNISIIDDTANAFSMVSDTFFTVAPGDSDTIVVRFAPKSEGEKGDTLKIESDDPDTPIKKIPLSGNGVYAVEEVKVMLPKTFYLSQNLPNPAISMTRIPFGVPKEAHITLTIYDISGKKVRTLMARTVAVGHHIINWNGKDDSGKRVAKGIYFYRMEAGKFKATRKLTILR